MAEEARRLDTLRRGDIFRWAAPLPDEDPDRNYVLLDDPARTRGRLDISPLGTGMTFVPINRVGGDEMVVFVAHAPTPEEGGAGAA